MIIKIINRLKKNTNKQLNKIQKTIQDVKKALNKEIVWKKRKLGNKKFNKPNF